MQFDLILRDAIRKHSEISELQTQLKRKEEFCIWTRGDAKQCAKKRLHFQEYLREYGKQFREKGVVLCSQAMSEHASIDKKIEAKDECIQFYAKSLPIVTGNVADKLRSLVQGTDFSQL